MHSTTIRTTLAVLAAAVALPATAAARPDPMDSGDWATTDIQAVAPARAQALPPDDRPGIRGAGNGSVQSHIGTTYDVGGVQVEGSVPNRPEVGPDERPSIGVAASSAARSQTGSPYHEDSSLDPAFRAAIANRQAGRPSYTPQAPEALKAHSTASTAAIANRRAGGPSYTPKELEALKAYSKASFAEKKAILAGGKTLAAGDLKAIRAYSSGWFATESDLQAGRNHRAEDPYLRALRLRGEAMNRLYASTSTSGAVRPDDRAGLRGIQPTAAASSSQGFDWNDAAIGAIGALGASLLAAGGMLLTLHVVHQRRDKVAAL